jgi:hypothetical protein
LIQHVAYTIRQLISVAGDLPLGPTLIFEFHLLIPVTFLKLLLLLLLLLLLIIIIIIIIIIRPVEFLSVNFWGKQALGRSIMRQKGNIKMNIRKMVVGM